MGFVKSKLLLFFSTFFREGNSRAAHPSTGGGRNTNIKNSMQQDPTKTGRDREEIYKTHLMGLFLQKTHKFNSKRINLIKKRGWQWYPSLSLATGA